MRNFGNYIKKILLLLIALQILDTGLFAQDFPCINGDQNIINSVTEYVAEVILKETDTFPEHQENDHQKTSHSFLFKVQQYVLFKHTPASAFFEFISPVEKNKYTLENNTHFNKIAYEITPPPPKA